MFDPKFNIVSPGANPDIFFPFTKVENRFPVLIEEIDHLVRGDASVVSRGELEDPDKPLLFSMARLDVIKNLVGLTEWFGKNQAVREKANLLLVAGYVNPDKSRSREEKEQIEKMHQLMDKYALDGQLRWLEMQTEKQLVGELYRYVADKQGAFVQPALFEAFGLTVIEAMTSGLPVFATRYGGPAEIIAHGISGFHIDPNHGDAVSDQILQFLLRCEEEPGYWQKISHNAITRIASKYTWKLYAHRFLRLAKIYGFWKYVSNLDRQESRRYLEMFYSLMFRPRSQAVLLHQEQD